MKDVNNNSEWPVEDKEKENKGICRTVLREDINPILQISQKRYLEVTLFEQIWCL